MDNNPDWSDLPVWRCCNERCGSQWAANEEAPNCPFCHWGASKRTGFTCGEVAAAAEKYGFDEDFPVHIPEPVLDVVQLSTLPPDTWVGLPVYHPFSQDNDVANWLIYDVGIVIDVYPDPDFTDELRCRFVHSYGSSNGTLQYGPKNLWVPRVLADRLAGGR